MKYYTTCENCRCNDCPLKHGDIIGGYRCYDCLDCVGYDEHCEFCSMRDNMEEES